MGKRQHGNGWKLHRPPRSASEKKARLRAVTWLRNHDIALANGRVSRHRGFAMWCEQDVDPCLNYSKWKKVVLQAQTDGDLRAWRGAAEPAEATRPLFFV